MRSFLKRRLSAQNRHAFKIEKTQPLIIKELRLSGDPPGKVLGILGCYHMLLCELFSGIYENWSSI